MTLNDAPRYASEQLDRILELFNRIETKASILLAIDTGMLAFISSHASKLETIAWWGIIILVVFVTSLLTSLWCIYKSIFPNLNGGNMSLIYFKEIAKRTEAKFIDEFNKQKEEEYLNDILGQVWRNSNILNDKFNYLKLAFIFLLLSIPGWAISLIIFAINKNS